WSIVTSPNTSTTQSNGLGGVTCASASNCWAVGSYYNLSIIKNQPHHTLIERWNGTAWSIVTSPNTSTTDYNQLSGVTCASAADCWAVGYYFDYHDNVYHTLIERYSSVVPAQLDNISTRAFVQTGDNVMIGGFIIEGSGPKTVIIRAIGPELTQYAVPNALANPTLELHDGTGALIARNDNWQTSIIGGIITSNQT